MTEGLDLPFYQLGKVLSGGALMNAAEFYQCLYSSDMHRGIRGRIDGILSNVN